jgi:hypothetical protein
MRPVIRLLEKPLRGAPKLDELRTLLVKSADNYCLICEIPLGNEPYVTARVYINQYGYRDFPTGETNSQGKLITNSGLLRADESVKGFHWVNATLCCKACYEAQKGPDWIEGLRVLAASKEAKSLLGKVAPGRLDEARSAAIYQYAAKTWIWPDSAEDGAAEGLIPFEGDDTWSMLDYGFASLSQAELAANRLVRLSNEEMAQSWTKQKLDGYWVGARKNLSDAERDRVLNTIIGFNLNYWSPYGTDQRVKSRTNAALQAQQQAKALDVDLLKQKDAVAASQWLVKYSLSDDAGTIRETIRATGFWTAWARIFVAQAETWLAKKVDPWAIEACLMSLFVQYEQALVRDDDVSFEDEEDGEVVKNEGQGEGSMTDDKAKQDQGQQKEQEDVLEFDEDDNDDAVCFPMVLEGTDLRRLPKVFGGPR